MAFLSPLDKQTNNKEPTLDIHTHNTGVLWPETDITFEGFQDHHYTSITIVTDDGRTVLGRGTARRDPADRYKPEIGQQLALGRALVNAGNKILKQGNGLVNHNSWVAEERAKRKEDASGIPWEHFMKRFLGSEINGDIEEVPRGAGN